MTCGKCVAKVKSELLKLGHITEAIVQLSVPQATISMQKHVQLSALQQAVAKAGLYQITETAGSMHMEAEAKSRLVTYKPVVLIGGYILGSTLLLQFANSAFNFEQWMRHFMTGFFLVFSFLSCLTCGALLKAMPVTIWSQSVGPDGDTSMRLLNLD